MPTYPIIKTFRGGFYNSVNGDRTYNARDVRKPYATIYSPGIKPDHDGSAGDTLEVVAKGGLSIAVNTGFALLGEAWFENESQYTIELDAPTAATRYDCVIIRNDESESTRGVDIYIKSLDHIPTSVGENDSFDIIRNNTIYELCIAYVEITSSTTNITQDDIIDTRTEGKLCNVMSGVGATVVRTYKKTYWSEIENQTDIPIGIPQFDRTRDTLSVLIEGRITNTYTVVDNSKITLGIGLPLKGTRVDFEVVKNVNAAGADTIVQEVGELRNEVTLNNSKLEYDYYCNGVNDNEIISYLITDFLRSGTNSDSRKFNIIGHFGYSRTMSGEGTNSNPYKLFDFIIENTAEFTRNVILDFSSCDVINFTPTAGKESLIFNTQKITIIGANIRASNNAADTVVRVFNLSKYHVTCERCRFWITGYRDSIIARNGTFINCRCSITNTTNNSYCFNVTPNGILELISGEYYAYVGNTTNVAAIVGQSGETSASVLHGVSAPAKTRNGYKQTHAIYQMTGGGYVSTYGLITSLPRQLVSGQSSEVGTIPLDKENII